MVLQEQVLSRGGTRSTRAAAAKPRLHEQVLARLRWPSLDQRLMAGEDPASSAQLAARAARLTSPRVRAELSEALHGLLRAAEQPARAGRISPDRSALAANEGAMLELARRLGSGAPVYARGLARLHATLVDGTGPVYRGPASALASELAAASAELGGAASTVAQGERGTRPGRLGPLSRRRLRRTGRMPGRAARPPLRPPAVTRGSIALPDGSWLYGRRESS